MSTLVLLLAFNLPQALFRQSVQQPLEESKYVVNCVAFSKEGTYLAVGSTDGKLLVWNQGDFKKKQSYQIDGTCINALAFAHDSTLAAACDDGRVYVFDVTKIKLLFKLDGDGKALYSCLISSKGDVLFTAGASAQVVTWSLAKQQALSKIPFEKPITRVSLLESSGLLAANLWRKPKSGFDLMQRGEVILYDLKKNETKQVLTAHKSRVTFIKLLATDKLVTAGYDGRILLHDLSKGEITREWMHGDMVTSVAIAEKTGKIASGDADGTVKIWDFKTGIILESSVQKGYMVTDLVFSPDERSLVLALCHESLSRSILRLVRFLSLE